MEKELGWGNAPFLGILDFLAKLQPKVGIQEEGESKIPRKLKRSNQMDL